MIRTLLITGLITAWAASATAQTGSGVSFFPRAEFRMGAEHLSGIDDERFRWDANFGGALDLVDYTAGRLIFAASYQAILGEELQKFDPNQGNYILEGALRLWLGKDGEQELTVNAGEILTIPSNLPHRAEALEDTLELDVFSPVRAEWVDAADEGNF